MQSFNDIQSIYFIGIGGAGMSGLARMAHLHGKQVSGSDIDETAAILSLRNDGITVYTPQSADHVPLDADLYVYSDAVQLDNVERAVVEANGLHHKAVSYFAALGEFIKLYHQRVAISGTHGKTTTTAMMALVLEAAKKDPAAIVGSMVTAWKSNVRVGQTDQYVVIEACEYKEHMLELDPTTIVLNNIEEDHLDFYRDLDHIIASFQTYVSKLPENGLLVVNVDDAVCRELVFEGNRVTFGITESADVMATDIQAHGLQQTFVVKGVTYTLQVPGLYNVYNALGVIAYCLHIGIDPKHIQAGLKSFTGTWRRFEYLGEYNGADIISDYAHHPTAINGVIQAAKDRYPNRRIVIAYQPHQHNRTHKLFSGFVKAFDGADLIIVQEIFDVAGREAVEDQIVSSTDLVREIEQRGKLALFTPNAEATTQRLREHIEPKDVVLIVGAGDIYKIGEQLCRQ